MKKHIAIDLGASNGRVLVGDLGEFEVVHRFVTQNDQILGEFYWNIQSLFAEIKVGLKKAFTKYGSEITSIGIDTWGVDYVLTDAKGSLVSLCYHYRDSRTDGLIERVSKQLGGKMRIYERTGIAFQPFNTLYQLAAMQRDRPEALRAARHYLSVPDLLAYWLTGIMKNERTHASTTQLYDPMNRTWAWDLIDDMGFDRSLFGDIVDSGTVLGSLTTDVAHEVGATSEVSVIASAAHDTASAVAAVPAAAGQTPLYISSGTWSLLGVELPEPRTDKASMESGFTNEVAASGGIRFLKNIMGMWIQQECVRYWEGEGQEIHWKELDEETLQCADYRGYIDPADARFLKPNTYDNLMTDRIDAWCREHDLPKPSSNGEYMVAIYRGLAKAYAKAISDLESVIGKKFTALHIIGGGCKNEILDQWAASETGLTVYAGPVEATALGNLVVQAWATGELESLQEGRDRIKQEQKVKIFRP
ncbi:rhamnulokinase [Sphaerochaeta halotolerans]|uniref:rhamnulokinase n=1 Tax=Sphaerochaeta halotolerans TaxID=2293840 RepID=UPI001371708E|nr:rhamnulokinase family protein [Sphaerochaeta halotolerans]MXI85295.1 rhamnulokinase [Sphaerochaeta halotolerans]